jgi:hypothetical protein
VELIRQTDTIEASLKATFGFHFSLAGLKPGEEIVLRKVVVHPPIRNDAGDVSTGYEREMPTVVRHDGTIAGFQGFGFDHPYELVAGKWTIEVWRGSQKLAAKTFTVVLRKS